MISSQSRMGGRFTAKLSFASTSRRLLSNQTNKTVKDQVKVAPPVVTLYQYHICPFCNINKALLSYTETPYNIVEVNPLTKAEIKFSTDYKKVPIMDMDHSELVVNGSKEINQALLRHPYLVQKLEDDVEAFAYTDTAQRWNDFATDELAPVLYPNICRSLSESYEAFGYVNNVKEFSAMQKGLIRGVGSFAMYIAASKIKSKRNITDERVALSDILTKWEEDGLDSGKKAYASGLDKPDLGDVAMFGVMNSVNGLTSHTDVILKRGGTFGEWYARMSDKVRTA
mmetsp:Transcript_23587/g.35850  ORF Transcript_23587/g.35850 Transcript_23587/m.35850 type:complete len:284 (-) Transcript_23587:183-1034(-)